RTQIAPRVLDAREVELALRGKVPVENRLRAADRPADLRSRRPAEGAFGEHAARRLEHMAPPLLGGELGPCLRHATSTAATGTSWRTLRTVATATIDPASAIAAAAYSAW